MAELYNSNLMDQRKIVESGELDGYPWYIVSYGSHPCAYVKSDISKKTQEEILVHGGITFAGKAFPEFELEGQYIGWDYQHYGDYSGLLPRFGGKRWTVDEIMDDVRSVVHQLKEMGR